MEITHEFSTRSDAELLRLAVAGEEQAFLLLYGRLKAGIFRYAFYMTSSKVNAEEVTQEVFITLLKESHNYRQDRGDLAAFAFGIARNFVRRIERRERPYEPLPEDAALATLSGKLISESDALPARMIRTEVAGRVQAAVASLPDHYRLGNRRAIWWMTMFAGWKIGSTTSDQRRLNTEKQRAPSSCASRRIFRI